MAKTSLNMRRVGLAVIAIVLAVLTYAVVDGGQEPIRPITQNIAVPETVQ